MRDNMGINAGGHMGFGEAIGACFRKYVVFSGRARRSEYWYFYLFTVLASFAGQILDALIPGSGGKIPLFSGVLSLAFFLPSLAVTVRRLHDTNRSGWLYGGLFIYALLGLVAVFATFAGTSWGAGKPDFSGPGVIVLIVWALGFIAWGIFLFVLMVLDGNVGANTYGPDPKGPDVAVFS